MEEVRGVSSRIFIWPGIHAEVGENLRVLAPHAKHVFILTDRKCIPIAKRVALGCLQANFEVAGYAMYPGESRKTVATVQGVYNKLAREGVDRTTAFVTVGGGVVTDLGGFVAGTYREGLKLFHVPTSFVAQVDAAFSGKTGVHLKEGRNLVAATYPAVAVFADPSLLETLPRRDYLAGLAEVVKYGMVREADLLAFLEENLEPLQARNPLLLEEIVYRCATIRAAVDHESPWSGVGPVLNYGRVVGRGLERAGLYRKIAAGDALAVGMEAELGMAERMGIAAAGVGKVQNRILRKLDLPTRVRGLPLPKLVEAMCVDQKNVGASRLKFVLPERVGAARHGVEVPLEVIEESLRAVLLPGGRMRATRPLQAVEAEQVEGASPAPSPAP